MILTITMNPSLDKTYSIDNFKINKTNRISSMIVAAGGKGINVARVLHILKENVIASGLLGGSQGKYIEELLNKKELKSDFVKISGETRSCINIQDKVRNTSTEILESGPIINEKEINNFIDKYKYLLKGVKIVTASGSLPRGLPDDFYKRLIKIAKKYNKKFLLDTSGDYFLKGIKEVPFMVTPNREEIKQLYGEKYQNVQDYIYILVKFKKMGIKIPVVTMGKEGSIVIINNGIYHLKAPELDSVINSVGSGDAFLAGCAMGILKGDKLKAIKLGMACGIANTQFIKTGMISEEKVNRFQKIIKINKIGEINKDFEVCLY